MAGLDQELFRALDQAGSNLATDLVFAAFTFLGMSYVLILVIIPLWLKGKRAVAFDIILLIIISDIVSEVVKTVIERPRPAEVLSNVRMLDWGFVTSASGFSFPSGHALRSFAVGAYLALSLRGGPWWAASLASAVMIGLSRIYLGLHWPSDVLAGAAIGIMLAVAFVIEEMRQGPYAKARTKIVAAIELGMRRAAKEK